MKRVRISFLILLIAALLLPALSVLAYAEDGGEKNVTLISSYETVDQGGYYPAFVIIDNIENISSLSVSVHFDPSVIEADVVYNQAASSVYDNSVTSDSINFSYIFTESSSLQDYSLFYFYYKVKSDAPVGKSYFDVVVNEAYDSSLNVVPAKGSRTNFNVARKVISKSCYVYSDYYVNTVMGDEFELTYSLNTLEIASGTVQIDYDKDLFRFVSIEKLGALENKLVDVNTNLTGAISLSFVGTEYAQSTSLLKIKFKAIANMDTDSRISFHFANLYDLSLNEIGSNVCDTTVFIRYDESLDENIPRMYLTNSLDADKNELKVLVKLSEDSGLGAGDFVLSFDPTIISLKSFEKKFSPSFFNVNDKEKANGKLKFSIISLSDITASTNIIELTFDVLHPHNNASSDILISGSGLSDSLTNPIMLHFVDSEINPYVAPVFGDWETVTEPSCSSEGMRIRKCTHCDFTEEESIEKLAHTVVTDEGYAPTCILPGLSDGSHCSVCGETIVPQTVIPVPTGMLDVASAESNLGDTNIVNGYDGDFESSYQGIGSGNDVNYYMIDLGSVKYADTVAIKYDIFVGAKVWVSADAVNWYTIYDSESNQYNGTVEVKDNIRYIKLESQIKPGYSYFFNVHELQARIDIDPLTDLNHSPADAVQENVVPATCTDNGHYDEVIYCKDCGLELSRVQRTIDSNGHSYDTPTYAWNGDKCTATRVCKHDGSHVETETVTGAYVKDTDATCLTNETGHYVATFTNSAFAAQATQANSVEKAGTALGHSYEWVIDIIATKTSTGIKHKECTRCHDKRNEGTVIDMVECDHSGKQHSIAHSPTCTEPGAKEYWYCPDCERYFSDEACQLQIAESIDTWKIVSPLGHDFSYEWTIDLDPTCTEYGSKSHHCSRCEEKADITAIDPKGHSYGEWIETKAPTCTEKGKEKHVCSVCTYEETRAKDELGHDYAEEWTVDVEPDCTHVGSKSHHCRRCEAKSDVTEIPATGYIYGDANGDVTVNHSASLTENFAYNYYYTLGENGSDFGKYDDIWLELRIRDYSDADSYEFSDEDNVGYNIVIKTLDWTKDTSKGYSRYKFTLNSIAAAQVGDLISASLHATKDGQEYYTSADESSIALYAYNRIEKSSDAALKTLLVDMLNYCAEAQTYFGYHTERLVNADLTDAQKVLATVEDIVPTQTQNIIALGGTATGFFNSKTINLGNAIELKYYMTFDNSVDLDNVTLRLSYQSLTGETVNVVINGSDFGYDAPNSRYFAKLTTISAADTGSVVSATIYENDIAISDTLEYGIEVYCKNRFEKSTDTALKDLLQIMLKYTRNAQNYFSK